MRRLSKQYRWQLKQKHLGRCIRCGRKRERYSWHCNKCRAAIKARLSARLAPIGE